MSKIVIDHVTKIYPGDVKAADDVTLEIASGEFMVLVGPSGCGKSTLMRMVAGLEDVTEGTILIDERRRDRALASPPRHRDGLPELRALPPHDACARTWATGSRSARRRRPRSSAGSPRWRSCSGSRICSTAALLRSREASGSVSRWGARSSASPRRSSWTSRCRTSTRSSGWRCAPSSRACTSGSA